LEPLGYPFTDTAVKQTPHVVASRKDARQLEARGCPVALVEHGAGQRYHIDAGGPDSSHPNVELFLAPSQRVADQSAHLFPNAETVVVGSPRLEHLASLDRPPSKVILAFHWVSTICPEAGSAWTHYQRALSLLGRFDVVGHAHPKMLSKLRTWYKQADIPVEPDWRECVKQAAVLVCDNSSIMWEACALDIPVVVLNAPWFRRDVDFGLRFWEFADIGPQVEQPRDLPCAIEAVLTGDVWADRRREAAAYVYERIDGSIAAAREAVERWRV
jgi:hypothetical protein